MSDPSPSGGQGSRINGGESPKPLSNWIQLYSKPSDQLQQQEYSHDLALIFFHGLFNEASSCESTWIQRGEPGVCWPRDWLPKEDLCSKWSIQVLTVIYRTVGSEATESLVDKAKILLHDMVNNLSKPAKKIVLVGYDVGGLVIKSMVVELYKAAKRFPRNAKEKKLRDSFETFKGKFKGIAFYNVPHFFTAKEFRTYVDNCNTLQSRICSNSGASTGQANSSEQARIPSTPGASCQANSSEQAPSEPSPVTSTVDAFSFEMEQLTSDFEDLDDEGINYVAFVEGKKSQMINYNLKEVHEIISKSSADELANGNTYEVHDVDHRDVCKPLDEKDPSYTLVLTFAEAILKQSEPNDASESKPSSPKASVRPGRAQPRFASWHDSQR